MPHPEMRYSADPDPAALRADIADLIRPLLPRPCWLSIDIAFSGPNYLTEKLK